MTTCINCEGAGSKAQIFKGAFLTAEKDEDGIVLLTLQDPHDKVNTLKGSAIEEFDRFLDVLNCTAYRGLIGTAHGIAGANLDEIHETVEKNDLNLIINTTERAKAVFMRFRNLPAPKVFAMQGPWVYGGGLEWPLFSFNWRIAVPAIKLGLPEVKAGIFPGFGGTWLVPSLMARLTDAVEFITTGKSITAQQALELGLIDQIVSSEELLEEARRFILRILGNQPCEPATIAQRLWAARRQRRKEVNRLRARKTRKELKGLFQAKGRQKVIQTALLPAIMENLPFGLRSTGRKWLGRSIEQIVRNTTITTSPVTAVQLVMKARERTLEEALAHESKRFAEEALSPFARGILHFLAHKKGARDAFAHVPVPHVEELAVLGGCGPMGAGIGAVFAAAPQIKRLVLVDMADKETGSIKVELVKQTLERIEKHLKKSKLSEGEIQAALNKIVLTASYEELAEADVIIEAVPERVDWKQAAYAEIVEVKEARMKALGLTPPCLMVLGSGVFTVSIFEKPLYIFSNTSALDLDVLAEKLGALGMFFAGMHFFNPVEDMPLVEIIRGSATTDEAMALATHLVAMIDKSPVPCFNKTGDVVNRGFIVNRMLGPYMSMIRWLLADGVPPEDIAAATKHFGILMDPATLLDVVGGDIAMSVANSLRETLGERMAPPEPDRDILKILLDRRYNDGRKLEGDLGKKTGAGIFLWKDGEKVRDAKGKAIVNPYLLEQCPWFGQNRSYSREAIQMLLVGPVINEFLRVVKDGVVAPEHLDWIDIACILGTSICGVYGGPGKQLDAEGSIVFYRRSKMIARWNKGKPWSGHFQPSEILEYLAKNGMSFATLRKELAANGESFAAYIKRKEGEAVAREAEEARAREAE